MQGEVLSNAVSRPQRESALARIGIPPSLLLGYVGLLLFMVGDGVESGYLPSYLVTCNISTSNVAWIFTFYGGMVALAGWLSGALSDAWGPQRVIALGFTLWLLFQVAFLTFGLHHGYMTILITYALRGLGYPLFAFGFLVWITVVAPKARLASAMGWFWFAFTGGLPTLGSVVASWSLPRFGPIGTLWVATGFVAVGGLMLLVGVREPLGRRRLVLQGESPIAAISVSISLLWRKPKTAIACVVRIINTAPQFGFLVFLPAFFVQQIGFSLTQWLHLLSAIFLSNIIWNLLFGLVADRLGWVRTVAICGGFGCTLTTLAIFYVPALTHSFAASVLVGVSYGATLAAYVPLSALMPSLAPQDRGASLSLLSLGAGASVWVGPAMVSLLLHPLGVKGLMWVFAMLYLLSGILAFQLRTAGPAGKYPSKQEVANGMAID